jgi:hypothetical protein
MYRAACPMNALLIAGAMSGAWKPLTQTGRFSAGWHTRMSNRLAGKGVCACLCAGFQHPASAVASNSAGGDAASSAPDMRGRCMRKLRWWQWGLISFVGLAVIGSLADPKSQTNQDRPASVAGPTVKELGQDGFFSIVVDQRDDPMKLPWMARDACGARAFCSVWGWTDSGHAARGYPMTEREAASLAFSYSVNRSTGAETILWD